MKAVSERAPQKSSTAITSAPAAAGQVQGVYGIEGRGRGGRRWGVRDVRDQMQNLSLDTRERSNVLDANGNSTGFQNSKSQLELREIRSSQNTSCNTDSANVFSPGPGMANSSNHNLRRSTRGGSANSNVAAYVRPKTSTEKPKDERRYDSRPAVNFQQNNEDQTSNEDQEGWQVQRSKSNSSKKTNFECKEKLNAQFHLKGTLPVSISSDSYVKSNVNQNQINTKANLNQQPSLNRPSPTSTENTANSNNTSIQNNNVKDDHTSTEPAQNTKRKKKRYGTKEERRAKREEAQLKELYKPKDSHVQLLDPELFRKIKGEENSGKSCQSYSSSFQRPQLEPSASTSAASASVTSSFDFPSLGDSLSVTTVKYKTFASTLSSTASSSIIPPITSTPPIALTCISKHTLDVQNTPTETSEIAATTPSWPKLGDLFPTTSKKSNIFRTGVDPLIQTTSVASTPSTPISKNTRLSRKPMIVNLDALIQSSKAKGSNILDKQIAKKNRKSDRTSNLKENYKLTKGNILDSSGPGVIQRGKIRQKIKKPTKLKKAILASRQLRKALNLTEFSLPDTDNSNQTEEAELSTSKTLEDCDTTALKVEKEEPSTLDSIVQLKESLPEVTKVKSCAINIKEKSEENNIFKKIIETAQEDASVPAVSPGIEELVKTQMHSRKFRLYCDMYTNKEFHYGLVVPLMKELYRLQDRLYKTDPMKFKIKRRYVNGLKDAVSVLKLNKAQMIILAPDIEPNSVQGGLDQKITEIIALAQEKKVPYVFSGNRFILGKCIMQSKSPVSAIAIVDKSSTEDQFKTVVNEAEALREKYRSDFDQRVKEAMAKVMEGL